MSHDPLHFPSDTYYTYVYNDLLVVFLNTGGTRVLRWATSSEISSQQQQQQQQNQQTSQEGWQCVFETTLCRLNAYLHSAHMQYVVLMSPPSSTATSASPHFFSSQRDRAAGQLFYLDLDTLKITPGPLLSKAGPLGLQPRCSHVTAYGIHLLAESDIFLDPSQSTITLNMESINMRTGALLRRWCVQLPTPRCHFFQFQIHEDRLLIVAPPAHDNGINQLFLCESTSNSSSKSSAPSTHEITLDPNPPPSYSFCMLL